MNREFRAPRLNALWGSAFTDVTAWSGSIDAYVRRIAGCQVSRTAHATFVLDALEQALHECWPLHGGWLVHNRDRGAQYLALRYTERLAEAGVETSVVSVGDSYDNALARRPTA